MKNNKSTKSIIESALLVATDPLTLQDIVNLFENDKPSKNCQWKNNVRKKGETCDKHSNCKDEYECSKGTCGPYHWPRRPDEPCVLGTDCKNYNILTGAGTQCCKGKCQDKIQDWAGAYYCPHEVKLKLV